MLNNSKPVGIVLTEPHSFGDSLYHPCLQKIEQDLLAIERSVLECATAGCSSIWVCCSDSMQPIVRSRLGAYVRDPLILRKSSFTNYPEDNRINIPIYFYSPHPKDRYRRPGPAWDMLNCCLAIYYFSFSFSKWLSPNKYYISSCYGLYDIEALSKHRKQFMQNENTILTHGEKSMFSGDYLAACLTGDFIKDTIIALKRRPVSKKSNVLHLENLDLPTKYKNLQIDEYFSCDSWENYVEYIKNKKFRFKYNRKVFFNMNSNGVEC